MKLIKNFIKLLRQIAFLTVIQFFDFWKYLFYSFGNPFNKSYNSLLSRITLYYHSIEKGLSHSNLKLGFGKYALSNLYENLYFYIKRGYPINNIRFISGITALQNYVTLHDKYDFNVDWAKEKLNKLLDLIGDKEFCKNNLSTVEIDKSEVIELSRLDFPSLISSRKSVRNFSNEPVDLNLITKSIELAINSPSACNRQPWRVYILRDKKLIKEVLSIQGGFRGFGENLDTLLVVTTNYSMYGSYVEINSSYIDGGIFSMNLISSLQYQGLATCILNLSLKKRKEIKLRKILNISKSEVFILSIAVGNYQDKSIVPKSERLKVEDITHIIK